MDQIRRRPLRKLGVIIALGCIIFQSIGLMGISLLGQFSCKIHAASVSELDSRVTSFYFKPLEFAQVRLDKKEFKLDGHMFDIVRINKYEDCLEVLAFKDGKEEEILKSLASIFDLDSDRMDHVMHDIMSKIMHLTYVISSPIILSFHNIFTPQSIRKAVNIMFDRIVTVDIPPPKCIPYILG